MRKWKREEQGGEGENIYSVIFFLDSMFLSL